MPDCSRRRLFPLVTCLHLPFCLLKTKPRAWMQNKNAHERLDWLIWPHGPFHWADQSQHANSV
jgi:hypothetical protein